MAVDVLVLLLHPGPSRPQSRSGSLQSWWQASGVREEDPESEGESRGSSPPPPTAWPWGQISVGGPWLSGRRTREKSVSEAQSQEIGTGIR